MELTPAQQKKLLRLAKIADNNVAGVAEELDALETKFDKANAELATEIENAIAIANQTQKMPGPQGVQGIQGKQGIGKDGKDGKDGRDGKDGIRGKDGIGKDGKNGVDGIDGKDGKDGSPDSPLDIVRKLESITDEDSKLRITAITGLQKHDDALSDSVISRAIGIIDQRTSFLINKVSNLKDQVDRLPSGGGGSSAWGSITGTLSNQTDLQSALDAKLTKNVAITGATKTKITYDTNGLVTAGADATTADVADSANKRYVTDAQLVVIGNTSNTNTGDQTITLTGAVTGTGTGTFATTIATPGTLTVASTNSTATAHTHAITSSSAPGAAASLLATDASGIIGSTGTRIVKIWAIDLTVTNAIAGSITGNAATVTTNANLTGPITSVGNATSVAAQTGTGSTFVMDTSPTLVTPNVGVATATTINKVTITAPATSATLTIQDGKTFTVDETGTLSGYALLAGRTGGQTLNGGTATSDTLVLQSNSNSYPRTARTSLDMLSVMNTSYTYPSGSAANFQMFSHSPTVSAIDVANPNIGALSIAPTYVYTTTQSAGLGTRAGMAFNPTWKADSSLGAASDTINAVGISCSPKTDATGNGAGRTINQNIGFFSRPEVSGTAGTTSSVEGYRAQPVVATGTTITDLYGLRIIPPTTGGSVTNFYGILIADSALPGTLNIAIRQQGTNAHNRFNGNVKIGADSTPGAALDVAGALLMATGDVSLTGTHSLWFGGLGAGSRIRQDASANIQLSTSGTDQVSIAVTTGDVSFASKLTKYRGVNTAGWGIPVVQAAGRSVAATAAVASVSTYTVGAADGLFEVSANVLVTTATTHSFTVTCAYTDEGNTARTITLNFSTLAGVISNAAITNVAGAVPYEGIPLHIRCKASTTITIATTGTFTAVTYNVEGIIKQMA